MSTDVSSFFSEKIEAVRGLEGRPLERALSRLLRDFQAHIWGWTRAACRAHGDRDYSHADDVFNVISLELFIVLRADLKSDVDPGIRNYWSFFKKISQREAFAYFHSGEVTGFSSAGGAVRRASKINKTRRELAVKLEREPSDIEVVNEVNRMAKLTRSNPEKQGALVTLEDLRVSTFSSLDSLTEEFGDSIWGTEEVETSPLTRVEANPLIDSIVGACEAESVILGAVAKSWIGEAMGEPPVVRTAKEVATDLALKLGEATVLMERCKEVAVRICAENFGISSPFA